MKNFIKKNKFIILALTTLVIFLSFSLSIFFKTKATIEPDKFQDQRKINDVIMVIDIPGKYEAGNLDTPEESETQEESTNSLNPTILDFAVAFAQTAAPIIVSANTFGEYLYHALDYKEALDAAQKDLAVLHPETPQSTDETPETIRSKLNISKMHEDPFYEYVFISLSYLLSKDKWFYFSDAESKIFLLIPKTQATSLTSKYEVILLAYGFNPNIISKIPSNIADLEQAKIFAHDLEKIIDKQSNKPISENETELLDLIKKMFISNINEPDNWWNIYLVGHADLAKSKDKDFSAISTNARIAGFSFNNFKNFITFLNGKTKKEPGINTLFFFYSSCFVGGYNQEFVRQTLNDLNANFFTVAQGTGEQSVSLNYYPMVEITPSRHAYIYFSYDFATFFRELRLFFTDPLGFTKTSRRFNWDKDPILSIMRSIVGYETIENNNQPFIYIPNVGVFGALNVDDRIKIISSTQAKAHEFENKEIDARGKWCLMVYPPRITVGVKLSDYTALMMMQPPKWEKQKIEGQERLVVSADYKTINYFDSITIEGIFGKFIYTILRAKSPYMQVWLFKEFTVINAETKTQEKFNNVMIIGKLPGTIYIMKENESGEVFQTTISTKSDNFQDNLKKLWEDCEHLSYQQLKDAKAFKPVIEALDLKSKIIADGNMLKQIFDILEKQTRSQTDIVEKGSLRRILENKKKSFDRAK